MQAYETGNKESKKGIRYDTDNVAHTIEEFSRKKNIPHDKIDFDILGVTTTVRRNETIGNMSEEIIILEKRGEIDIKNDIWLDKDIRITQKYEILLFPFEPNHLHLHIALAANSSVTNIAAFIKKDPKLIAAPNLVEFITNELNKKKLRHEFFINIFDDQMKNDISRISEHISKHAYLDRDVKVLLFNGPEFIASIDDSLSFLYQDKSTTPGGSKYIGVSPDEILVQYTKPKLGKSSRNAKGRYINCFEPVKSHEVRFTTSDSIKVEENEDKIVYSSIDYGFATIENNSLDVKSELSFVNMTAKSGSIEMGSNKHAKLEISSSEDDVDAVGESVQLSAYIIDIHGSVGADTYLAGEKITVNGQTHGTCVIKAKEVEIKTSKGIVEAEDAKIGILENGSVYAKNIKIASSLGATIHAHECKISILGSNSTIVISKLLTIESVSGSENKIIVTPAATREEEAEFSDLVHNIRDTREKLEVCESELVKYMSNIEQNVSSAKIIKAKLESENSKETINALSTKLRAFNETVEGAKSLKREITKLENNINELSKTIQAIQDRILHSKVVTENPWRGHNVIKFRLIEPPQELSITVDENNDFMEVFLLKSNGKYYIEVTKRKAH